MIPGNYQIHQRKSGLQTPLKEAVYMWGQSKSFAMYITECSLVWIVSLLVQTLCLQITRSTVFQKLPLRECNWLIWLSGYRIALKCYVEGNAALFSVDLLVVNHPWNESWNAHRAGIKLVFNLCIFLLLSS